MTQEDEDDCDVGKNNTSYSPPRDYSTPLSNCSHPIAPENVMFVFIIYHIYETVVYVLLFQ